jgi:hypothetical protein
MRHAHYDAIRFLCEGWDVVASPGRRRCLWLSVVASCVRFGTLSQKVHPGTGEKRVMREESVSQLRAWSHYSFNQRLQSAAVMRGVHVHLTPEYGTSRTCGRCGAWKKNLGGDEVYSCPRCHWEVNRDINGARNNLLCALTLLAEQRA